MKMKLTTVCVMAVAVLLGTNFAQAGDIYWNAGTGNWSSDLNWDHFHMDEPGSGDNAYINNGGTAQITAPNHEYCFSLYLGETSGDSGTVDMTGGTLSVTTDPYVGYGGDGTLNISGGAGVSSKWGFIGRHSGSTGAVTVEGAWSTWTNSGGLTVGDYGTGTLDITSGGAVSNEDSIIGYWSHSTGAVTVDGSGSTWTNSEELVVGKYGHGMLNISGGGAVSTGTVGHEYRGYIGLWAGSTGEVTVDGTGSTWTMPDDLKVGNEGTGTLNITGGGAVSNDAGYIGDDSGSTGTVTVDGTGSTWTNSRWLCVGHDGDGTLNVTDGGAVNSDDLSIGYRGDGTLNITGGGTVTNGGDGQIGVGSDSTGAVTVDGQGSTWTSSAGLHVGPYGDGRLYITGGGEVTVGGDTWVSERSGLSGTINFDNGTLTTGGLACDFDDLTGTGTINTHGLASDVDLVFDATHGLNRTFTIDDNPGQNITVNLDVDGSGVMGAGYGGDATMSISDGSIIQSTCGEIGHKSGSTGAVTVEGAGSTWTNIGWLCVGRYGDGTLDITDGGAVSNDNGLIGYESGSTGAVTVEGPGSTWTIGDNLRVGDGTLDITGGGAVSSKDSHIGSGSGSTGTVTVDGTGSTWTIRRYLYVGLGGDGTLDITGGGVVSNNDDGYIGRNRGSTGTVTVDGSGSTWTNTDDLYVGHYGTGTLNITGGGLVSVAGTLTIDYDGDDDGFINMSTGGMLALFGDADDSLGDFLGLIRGTGPIRYWDDDISDWDDITHATMGEDYQLAYLTAGNLSGYTMLTVPEPATLGLVAAGLVAALTCRRATRRKP